MYIAAIPFKSGECGVDHFRRILESPRGHKDNSAFDRFQEFFPAESLDRHKENLNVCHLL